MRRRWLFVAVLAFSFTLAGCDAMIRPASIGAHGELPTILLVTRSGSPPDHLLPLFGGSTDAAAVQRLYHAIYALPRMSSGVTSCPADLGIGYTLTFIDGSTLILRASVDATGCQLLRMGNSDTRRTDNAFWTLLARTTGISATDTH